MWDYQKGRMLSGYWHTFHRDFSTLAIVGLPRVLTFRGFEYQAVAIARLWASRNTEALPSLEEQEKWERERDEERRTGHRKTKFHDVPWDNGETHEWLGRLFRIAGLGTLKGEGRIPPALGEDVVWAIEHLRKYPEPGKKNTRKNGEHDVIGEQEEKEVDDGWVLLENSQAKDSLSFI